MTASTLPLVAALYCGDGHPWYPARPTYVTAPDANDVLWFRSPVIPANCPFRWAALAEVQTAGLDLTDTTVLAELLYTSPLDPARPVDAEQLRAAVLRQADACGCDLDGPIAVLAQDAGDHPADSARRMTWCLELARKMLEEQ